ncbi:MAG TPA: murein biosynthesis integral membrane protein MurJ [Vicinamibacterales bacterium]
MAPEPSGSSKLARSAASAGIATMASRILGLARDQVLASLFGAAAQLDAYYVAFRIPNLLRDLFAEGAMSAAFVPTFTKYLTTAGKTSAWRLTNLVLTALAIITGTLVLLGIVFAEPLVRLMTDSDYTSNVAKLTLTVELARVMMPTLTLIALAAALMGVLNSLHHFFIPALSPAMFNVVTIVFAFAVVPFMDRLGIQPIVAIAISTTLGGLAQLALQWPTLRAEGFRYRPMIDWTDAGLRRVLVLMGPGTIGLAATQVNLLVNTALATRQEGAVTWLQLAFRLMYFPIGLFGVSIATATLPAVSRHTAQNEPSAVRDTIADGLSLMLMLNVPATIGLAVLAVPIVRLLFEHGRFTPADTLATAAALQFYAIGLIGYSIVRIASPTFYALGRARTPVTISVITVLVNAALNITLMNVMGYRGLALGTSMAALFNATMLLVLLRSHFHGLRERQLLSAMVRIGMASALMGATAFYTHEQLQEWLPSHAIAVQALRLGTAIGLAVVVLAASAWALRIREFNEGVAIVVRRFRRTAR